MSLKEEQLWTVGAITLTKTYVVLVSGDLKGTIKLVNKKKDPSIISSKIFKVRDVEFSPLTDDSALNEDTEILNGIASLLKKEFYFSVGTGYDITWNLQAQNLSDDEISLNKEFCWNSHVLEELDKVQESDLAENLRDIPKVHLIQGFVKFNSIQVSDKTFEYMIISRRSQNRAGPRLLKRGINKKGQVANFVETEQIIFNDDYISSFIQIRGSVPIKWKQSLTLQWDPRIEIDEKDNHSNLSKIHFDTHFNGHDRVTVVNLMKSSGNEKDLTKKYGEVLSDNPKVNYIHFDIHKTCGHESFSKIHLLSDMIGSTIEQDSIFVLKNGEIVSKQIGLIRTNCKDNLDRTNLTQTYLASKAFDLQLIQIMDDSIKFQDLDEVRYGWADNGDALSLFYTGTPSLKGEQTRNGKGSLYSLWRDFRSSTLRFYLNNFEDGFYQDVINIFLGKSSPTRLKEFKNPGYTSRLISYIFTMFKPGYDSTNSLFGYAKAFYWTGYVFIVWKLFNLDTNAIVSYPRYLKRHSISNNEK